MSAVTFHALKFGDSHDTAERATKSDLRELELRVTIKFGAMLVAVVSVVAALIKL